MLSDLFVQILESSKKSTEAEKMLGDLLRDEKLLRQLWKQGVDIDWDRKDFDYRYLEFPEESMVVLICKMVGGGGHVEVSAGIFEQTLDIKGVEKVGMVPDGRRIEFRHVGRYKDFRGNQGDVFWRLLIQTGEEVRGSLFERDYRNQLTEIVNAIKDRVESV